MKNAIGVVLFSLTFTLVLTREISPWRATQRTFRYPNQRRGGPIPGYLPLLPVSTPRYPRWYWPNAAETAPRPSYARAPPKYEKFPPYWNDGKQQFKPQKPFRKDCNPCNSVPWTPIFKTPIHQTGNVPSVEVYPESSNQLSAVVPPDDNKNIILPAGNTPIAHTLLVPPKPVSYPQLNQLPIHQPVPFYNDPIGLVPPVPPKTSSNVIVTISETKPPENVFITPDQQSEPSSFNRPSQLYHPASQVDVIRSVPLAEYTSSIEYPLHVIQSGPYIDISTNNSAPSSPVYTPTNSPNNHYLPTTTPNYQKVSDFILNVGKEVKLISDNDASGSKITEVLETTTQASSPHKSRQDTIFRDEANLLTPPPLPPQLTQLLPAFETTYLQPLSQPDLANVVNGGLLPPTNTPLNQQPSKKIQIIIPYTTITATDSNSVTSINVTNIPVKPETLNTWMPIVVTESTQPRRIPEHTAAAQHVQHILANNIRDLLEKEMQKPEQNIRLQKNIDNWTALEYSNHQIVRKKRPDDVIEHAQAVTASPGTSISHLLFQSKKIPDGYLTSTTPKLTFEESSTIKQDLPSSINSLPFTYTTVSKTGVTTSKPKVFKLTTRQLNRMRTTTPTPEENEISGPTQWSDLKVSIAPGTNEKVYVVTPSNFGAKRTTRHADETTEDPPLIKEFKSKSKTKLIHPKSTPLFRIKANQSRSELLPKLTKPKPIERFFATTTRPLTTSPDPNAKSTTTKKPVEPEVSTIAVFPFRNGNEVPVEMATQTNVSHGENIQFRVTGDRKTLVKQINRKAKNSFETTPPPKLEIDVVLPHKTNISKKSEHKKATEFQKKKHYEKLSHDEPNITEDDREKINFLPKTKPESDEMLEAVETKSNHTLKDAIKALKEFLADSSEESKKPELSKIVDKMSEQEFTFPNYLIGELNLSKEEVDLIESAMVELKKKNKLKN